MYYLELFIIDSSNFILIITITQTLYLLSTQVHLVVD